jgi:MFS family permease
MNSTKRIQRLLPFVSVRNILIFYAQSACIGSFFCAAVWLFVWQKYLTLGEVGLVDWIAVIVAWLAEVPSGVLPDTFGRKWLVITAFVLSSLGIALQGVVTSFNLFLFANTLYLVGFSFYSGAAEALAYESLTETILPEGVTREQAYERVIAASNIVQLLMHVVSILIGTWSYNSFGNAAAFYVQGGVYFFGAALGLLAQETVAPSVRRQSISIWRTVSQSIGSVRLITRELVPVVLVALAVLGLYDFCAWSFLRTAIATKFGFDHEGYAVIINLGIIGAAIAVRMLPQIRRCLGDARGFPMLGCVMGLLFVACAYNLGSSGAVILVLIIMIGNLLKPWMSVLVNGAVSDEHRATMISLFGFITRVQFLLLGALVPFLAEWGYLSSSIFVLGAVATLASYYALRPAKN